MSLSEKIGKLLESRQVIKEKLKQHQMQEEITEQEMAKFTTPLVKKINEPIIQKMEEIKPAAPIVLPALEDVHRRSIEPVRKRKKIQLNIDRDIDSDLIKAYKYPMPSELMLESDDVKRNARINGIVTTLNNLLQSLGGRLKNLRDRDREQVEMIIKKFRLYKIALNGIQQIPHFEESDPSSIFQFGSPSTPKFGKGGLCNTDPCKRLELLIASKEAGNDAPEILQESKEILEKLYTDGNISRNDRDMITHHFLR